MRTLRELGEFALIERLHAISAAPWASKTKRSDLLLGIGDDAAIWQPRAGYSVVMTCDAQIEGRHFLPQMARLSALQPLLGRRCAQVNLSDIAAMGAIPRVALISLGLPPEMEIAAVEALYQGLAEAFAEAETLIAGGNLSAHESGLLIDITLLGEVEQGRASLRSGAKEGDCIGIIGATGAAAAGLSLLQGYSEASWSALRSEAIPPLESAYLRPIAHLEAARLLQPHAHAMIDTSDGLLSDLGHLLRASRVGARLWEEALPHTEALKRWALRSNKSLLGSIFAASDDYALLFCLPPEEKEHCTTLLQKHNLPLAWIGEITPPSQGFLLQRCDGSLQALEPKGWQHF